VDQEVEHPLGREFAEIVLRVMIGELVDPAVVGLARALGEAFELDKTGEVLIPLTRGESLRRVVFFASMSYERFASPFQRPCAKSPRSGSVQQAEALNP
jgi:hypothetical protein